MESAARVTAKSQVTIRFAIRRALGVDAGDELIFEIDPERSQAWVRKSADFAALAGSVPVPPRRADAEWASIRRAAWDARAKIGDSARGG